MRIAKKILIVILISFFVSTATEVSADGPVTYTVTFLDWNGDELRVQYVEEGTSAIYFEAFRLGHEFINWSSPLTNIQEDLTVTALYEPLEYTIVFLNYNGEVLSSQEIDYGTVLYPVDPPPREGYNFIGWSPEVTTVNKDQFYTALFEEIEVPEEPEEPEEPIDNIINANVTVSDLDIESNTMLEASVSSEVLLEKIGEITLFTIASKIQFPKLSIGNEQGVTLMMSGVGVEEIIDQSLAVDINLDRVDLFINSDNMAKLSNINVNNFIIETRDSSLQLKLVYNIDEMQGEAVSGAFEINYLYNTNQELPFDFVAEVEYDPLDDDGTYAGENPLDVSLVSYDATTDTYEVINAEYDATNAVYKFTLTESTVIIPMKLTQPEPIENEEFNFIEFITELDNNILYIVAFGSFVVVYIIVYIFEYIRLRRL